jgi:hypothetical protein
VTEKSSCRDWQAAFETDRRGPWKKPPPRGFSQSERRKTRAVPNSAQERNELTTTVTHRTRSAEKG